MRERGTTRRGTFWQLMKKLKHKLQQYDDQTTLKSLCSGALYGRRTEAGFDCRTKA